MLDNYVSFIEFVIIKFNSFIVKYVLDRAFLFIYFPKIISESKTIVTNNQFSQRIIMMEKKKKLCCSKTTRVHNRCR